jgi:hypothetical protein
MVWPKGPHEFDHLNFSPGWTLTDGVSTMIFLKKLLFRRSENIVQYFTNAVRVYVLKGEEDARCAALAMAKATGKRQRKFMIEQLSQMISNVKHSYPDNGTRKHLATRLLAIKEELELRDWGEGDAQAEKEKLSRMNEEYFSCLDRVDPSIFVKKHPRLF